MILAWLKGLRLRLGCEGWVQSTRRAWGRYYASRASRVLMPDQTTLISSYFVFLTTSSQRLLRSPLVIVHKATSFFIQKPWNHHHFPPVQIIPTRYENGPDAVSSSVKCQKGSLFGPLDVGTFANHALPVHRPNQRSGNPTRAPEKLSRLRRSR
jgi:hypothetical protein